jgi:hypothetical protein
MKPINSLKNIVKELFLQWQMANGKGVQEHKW